MRTCISPSKKSVVGCRWVCPVMVRPVKVHQEVKARLVAKGCNQVYCLHFFGTFSFVDKITFVEVCIFLAATLFWDLHQLNIKDEFLRSNV